VFGGSKHPSPAHQLLEERAAWDALGRPGRLRLEGLHRLRVGGGERLRLLERERGQARARRQAERAVAAGQLGRERRHSFQLGRVGAGLQAGQYGRGRQWDQLAGGG
jgi:hypothetical protein